MILKLKLTSAILNQSKTGDRRTHHSMRLRLTVIPDNKMDWDGLGESRGRC